VSSEPRGDQQCPICRTEIKLNLAESDREFRYWYEAEVGAVVGKKKVRSSSEVGRAPFPAVRWPYQEEAQLHGYETVKNWYVAYRKHSEASAGCQVNSRQYEVEFTELDNRNPKVESDDNEEEDDIKDVRESSLYGTGSCRFSRVRAATQLGLC
jgi:hypothetical protein